ncbi:hypothetical protein QE152_g24867 [Popillia japonica]|uniref:52 kDa repressor of the inhibitor of the protein kinase-like n=1 Tax=Popillia japonica TaxID=7064 RepID=A0AAW1K374_POPJA
MPAKVTKVGPSPRSFIVTSPEGIDYRRNRHHILKPNSTNDDIIYLNPTRQMMNPITHTKKKDLDEKQDLSGTSSPNLSNCIPEKPSSSNDITTRSGRKIIKPRSVGKGLHEQPKTLVSLPFKNWKSALECFEKHSKKIYHKEACIIAENFMRVTEGQQKDVHLLLQKRSNEEMQRNRKVLTTIIETIVFCGRQELALRGHRDSGKLSLTEPKYNDEYLRALLRYRIRDKDEDGMKLREDYLTFVPVHDLAGAALAGTLKEPSVSLGLNLNNLRGQGYDGASAMRSSFTGVQSIIREQYPRAIYTHCASHCLNLCLSDASKVTSIRNAFNAFGTINEVCTFFRRSAKRSNILKNRLKVLKDESNKNVSTLIKYYETRWVERHESVSLFADAFSCIVLALQDIQAQDKAILEGEWDLWKLKWKSYKNKNDIPNCFISNAVTRTVHWRRGNDEMLQSAPIPPSETKTDIPNIGERWKKWLNRLENYLIAANITGEERKTATLLHLLGEDALNEYISVIN